MHDPPKILIVDDEPFNVDFLEQELDERGYQTVSASNGQAALERVADENPDLVLLDIMMPIMDGFVVLARLKADAATRDLPVIVISAMSDMGSVVKGIRQGAEDYLPKPFDETLLHARISASLVKKQYRDRELEYLRNVATLTDAAAAVENATYDAASVSSVAARSDALGNLARVFQRMANEVRAREEKLKQQVHDLRIEIDAARQAKQVSEITDSDYFKSLRGQAASLRQIVEGEAK
jgi:PleD family two-component response regulator